VTVREDDLMTALTRFFGERVFGPDRAAMLAAALPVSAAEQATPRHEKAAALRRQLTRIDTADNTLITDLDAATTQDNDPTLLDAILGDILTSAPTCLVEQLLAMAPTPRVACTAACFR
jgi:hypothetical protein